MRLRRRVVRRRINRGVGPRPTDRFRQLGERDDELALKRRFARRKAHAQKEGKDGRRDELTNSTSLDLDGLDGRRALAAGGRPWPALREALRACPRQCRLYTVRSTRGLTVARSPAMHSTMDGRGLDDGVGHLALGGVDDARLTEVENARRVEDADDFLGLLDGHATEHAIDLLEVVSL